MQGRTVATWKEEGSGGIAGAGRSPVCGSGGRWEAGCAVQGAREVGGARRVRSSEPTLAARSGERGEQLSGAPDTPGLLKVTELELGQGEERLGGVAQAPTLPNTHPTSLTSGSSHLPPPLPSPPQASTPVPGRGRGWGSPAATPDAPGMLRAPELLTWGRDTRSGDSPSRGARRRARLLLVSVSSSASPGLRPGHGAARRGRAAAAVPSAASAAAAADRGRPVAAGSLCE